jgi:ATP-dependent Lon protease
MTEFEDISLEEMISDGFDIVAQEINIDDLAETEKNSEQKYSRSFL